MKIVLRGLDLDIEQEILSMSLGEMVLVNQP